MPNGNRVCADDFVRRGLCELAYCAPLCHNKQVRLLMDHRVMPAWTADWAWGLPIIVLTVVLHAYGLGILNREVAARLRSRGRPRHLPSGPSYIIGATALWATVLHALEGGIWAFAYLFLGALADFRSAMLYSISAITSFGHANLDLAPQWQMMGALEALNGWILFGLTTAFIFTVVQKVWPRSDVGPPVQL